MMWRSPGHFLWTARYVEGDEREFCETAAAQLQILFSKDDELAPRSRELPRRGVSLLAIIFKFFIHPPLFKSSFNRLLLAACLF